MLTHLSLCSGIGGIDIAAEWAGFNMVAQCEIDDYASRVLAKNFKGVHNFGDIRTITNESLRAAGIEPGTVTVMSAGIPCQPYSLAGKGLGDCDIRDLEQELMRVIGIVEPRWVVIENTPGLFSRKNQRYFDRICQDLSKLGYFIGWGMWGACDVGANHIRKRIFILAHTDCSRKNKGQKPSLSNRIREYVSNSDDGYKHEEKEICSGRNTVIFSGSTISDTTRKRCYKGKIFKRDFKKCLLKKKIERIQRSGNKFNGICRGKSDTVSLAGSERQVERRSGKLCEVEKRTATGRNYGGRVPQYVGREWWEVEPCVGRVDNGISNRVDRLRCLGNAVVPQQIYPVFKAIAKYELELLKREDDNN
jgi:DNA (cytosine-5)-methyltransferase 1